MALTSIVKEVLTKNQIILGKVMARRSNSLILFFNLCELYISNNILVYVSTINLSLFFSQPFCLSLLSITLNFKLDPRIDVKNKNRKKDPRIYIAKSTWHYCVRNSNQPFQFLIISLSTLFNLALLYIEI